MPDGSRPNRSRSPGHRMPRWSWEFSRKPALATVSQGPGEPSSSRPLPPKSPPSSVATDSPTGTKPAGSSPSSAPPPSQSRAVSASPFTFFDENPEAPPFIGSRDDELAAVAHLDLGISAAPATTLTVADV